MEVLSGNNTNIQLQAGTSEALSQSSFFFLVIDLIGAFYDN